MKPINFLHIIGIILIVMAVLMFFTCIRLWLNVLLVTHSKMIAGTEGIGVGAGVLKGTVNDVSDMFNFRYF